jgi:hypothetical protein
MHDLQENLQKFRDVVYFPRQNVNDNGLKMQGSMQKCKTPPHFTNPKGPFSWRRAIALLPPSMFHIGSPPTYHRRVNLFSTIYIFLIASAKGHLRLRPALFLCVRWGGGILFKPELEFWKSKKEKTKK